MCSHASTTLSKSHPPGSWLPRAAAERNPQVPGHSTGLWGRVKDGRVTYKQPDRPFHLLQHLAGIGGDRAHPRAPQHGEEPGLVHHVQVDRDVVLAVLPAQGQPSSEQQPEKTVHLGCDPALAATRSNCLESQTQGRSAGKAEDCSQLRRLHQPCLTRHAVAHALLFLAVLQHAASAGPHLCWPPGQSWDSAQAPQLPGSWEQVSHLISSEVKS